MIAVVVKFVPTDIVQSDAPEYFMSMWSIAIVWPLKNHLVESDCTNPNMIPLFDWLEKKVFTAIIIKQQFGFAIRTT